MRQPFETGGVKLPKGALVAFRDGVPPQVIFAPGPRQSIESVGVGRDEVYVAITDNVIGAVHVFTTNGKGWSDKVLPLPGQGAADIVSTNDFGPEALFSFQNYLTPPTHYFDDGGDKPRAIKSLPARFDASAAVDAAFGALGRGLIRSTGMAVAERLLITSPECRPGGRRPP